MYLLISINLHQNFGKICKNAQKNCLLEQKNMAKSLKGMPENMSLPLLSTFSTLFDSQIAH